MFSLKKQGELRWEKEDVLTTKKRRREKVYRGEILGEAEESPRAKAAQGVGEIQTRLGRPQFRTGIVSSQTELKR